MRLLLVFQSPAGGSHRAHHSPDARATATEVVVGMCRGYGIAPCTACASHGGRVGGLCLFSRGRVTNRTVPETGHLRVTLVNVTGYFLDPEICNKITLPITITKT